MEEFEVNAEHQGLSVTAFKIIAMAAVIVISLVGSLLPLRLHSLSEKHRNSITTTSKYFSAGVFLGVGLLHMLPEAAEGLEKAGLSKLPGGRHFPLAYGVAAIGFVLVWCLERRGHTMGGGGREQILAMAAQAEKCGGGSICYVQVETVASYGPVVCTSVGILPPSPRLAPVDAQTLPVLPLVLASTNDGPAQPAYVSVPHNPHTHGSISAPVIGSVEWGPNLAKQEGGRPRLTEFVNRHSEQQNRELLPELYRHGQSVSSRVRSLGRSLSRSSNPTAKSVGEGQRVSLLQDEEKGLGKSQPGKEAGHMSCPCGHDVGLGAGGDGGKVPLLAPPHCHDHHHPVKSASTNSNLGQMLPPLYSPLPRGQSGDCSSPATLQASDHSHDWGEHMMGVEGGSRSDRCSALHEHIHGAQHRHIVLPGSGAMSYMLAGLFSLHSFVVGAALGISYSADAALSLLIALMAHKGAEAFSVGVQFVREEVPIGKTIAIMLLYCAMTPVGIATGMAAMLMQGPTGIAVANLVQAFGAGTVLYIVMHQLNEHGAEQGPCGPGQGLLECTLLFVGLFLMSAVAVFA